MREHDALATRDDAAPQFNERSVGPQLSAGDAPPQRRNVGSPLQLRRFETPTAAHPDSHVNEILPSTS